MRTKNNQGISNRFDNFHDGHFLRDLLQEEGHGESWLALHTGRDVAMLESLLEQPNMDAELFVRIGLPLQPLFMQRVDESIFGEQPAELAN